MRTPRYTFEYVKSYFEEHGCKLLETSYVNSKTKMRYICEHGHKAEVTFGSFRRGHRCAECNGTKKFTYNYVKQYFKDRECRLLEIEYINALTKMKYVCSCGNESEMTFAHFREGKRCAICSGTEKYTFTYVKKYFEDNKCKLIELEYLNNTTPMKYICECGNMSKICFKSFIKGSRCVRCKGRKITETRSHPFEYIKKYFEDNKCKLLETEYINNNTLMKYTCEQDHTVKTKFNWFQQGHRCPICYSQNNWGVNHQNYNPDITDEERELRRNCPENTKWREAIYKKNNYICQKCGDNTGGNLNAHHIYPYSIFKLLRTHINNGITFCENCHRDFHYQYGYNCNYSQLQEFLRS